MAKDSDPLAGAFETKESGGLLSGLLAEEDGFDRRMMWRLGSWGAVAVGAVVVAVMANQAQLGWRRDQVAAADMARQAERLQVLTKESQNEARRLASAIDTLNSDRDRLYSRVTVLEQGLESVTGAIAKQTAAPSPEPGARPASSEPAAATSPQAAAPATAPSAAPSAAPSVAPVASVPSPASDKPRAEAAKEQARPPQQTAAAASLVAIPPAAAPTTALPAIPLVPAKSIMAPPDPAASKLVQPEKPAKPSAEAPAAVEAAATPAAKEPVEQPVKEPAETAEREQPAITVQQTRFAVDLGGASSVGGLRALWRGLTKSSPELAALRPIIMIKEGNTGLGMQLRLGAGPLVNAAAAAKICAALSESDRNCATTVFDGQRLSMNGHDAAPQAGSPPPAAAKPDKPQHRRSYSRRSKREEPPAPAPAPAKPETTSSLSSFFSRR